MREGEGRGRKDGGEIYYSIIIYRSQEAENVRTPQIPGKTGNEEGTKRSSYHRALA